MSKNSLAIIILAAGKGTRMKSAKAKVLHEIGGLPMLSHVIKTAEQLKPQKIVVVLGPGMEDVAKIIKPYDVAIQKSPKGTADAVKAAMPALKNFKGSDVLVLYGDVPLVTGEDLENLVAARSRVKNAGLAVAVMQPENPGSYGRVVLNKDGSVHKIVEAKDCSPAERNIDLCNAGMICADAKKLGGWLNKIKPANAQKEFYLTDLPQIAAKENVKTVIAGIEEDSARGINSRVELAVAETVFQMRTRLTMMESGVTLVDPPSVFFAWDTKIAPDVTIEPNVVFGPGVEIAANCRIKSYSHIEGTKIGKGVSIGPFARIRPDTVIGEEAKIGNFVEIKKSKIGKGSKINHLAYVGDTLMGEHTNFSAGAITVNYDGFDKHQTRIGKNVMVGSNVNLVAPVVINDGAFVAAGSTITEDVPANSLSIARERPKLREGWASEFRRKKSGKKK
ncbi:MAG: bifunctional UDP-N-acetylglucosamine diphosphorylase/glucosamine-1-phosphate N-acetyltransferase GlmU [Alphaproteobacteria bacterium]|nr:bifunctional UDP-N-acetylglucosamine diphosphorylase/glucosamine-1-phosphate N-acetyltransferase GlmU [Alphaproteobacteria bacterium]